ncbi:hypothetical protein Slala03_55680 [Streptomyces lavendulae subsp. lavendulae]|uniref:hypothetical protein n=2 Tax=Streptomyces lavendulae TaxID=1914 RepID=UPI0024A178D5|nr:hypothetical protein [Streptomyces lavendulae]GLV85879.1 hypothetical protein Slala03_55680 [Streptomyces lavendulae subsp. lavendulae]
MTRSYTQAAPVTTMSVANGDSDPLILPATLACSTADLPDSAHGFLFQDHDEFATDGGLLKELEPWQENGEQGRHRCPDRSDIMPAAPAPTALRVVRGSQESPSPPGTASSRTHPLRLITPRHLLATPTHQKGQHS